MPLRLALLLGLMACSGKEDSDPDVYVGDPEIELGTGEYDWESLEDGDEILIIQGPQGGHHLLGSVRTKGVEAGNPTDLASRKNPTTTFTATIDGDQLAPDATYIQGLDPAPSNAEGFTHAMIGRLVILDIGDDSDIVGKTVEFEVEVSDVDGHTLTDSRTLTVVPHPLNN